MQNVNIKKIELERLEGETASRQCSSFMQANRVLLKWATTAPKDGAYDKCRFSIHWEDGRYYSGRYDLHHYTRLTDEGTPQPDLVQHIIGFCQWVIEDDSGLNKQEHKDSAQDMIDNYLPGRTYTIVGAE